MASWVSGYRAVGGYFSGEVFNTFFGNVDTIPWRNHPNQYQFCDWYDNGIHLIDGYEIPKATWQSATPYTDIVLAVFDITQNPQPQYPVQMVVKLNMQDVTADTARAYISIYKRVYTDDTTYNDTIWGAGQGPVGYNFTLQGDRITDKTIFIVGFGTYNNTSCLLVGITTQNTVASSGGIDCNGLYVTSTHDDFLTWLGGDIDGEEFSPEFGYPSDIDGGYNDGFPHGSFDDSSDEIALDTKPTVGVSTAGFVRVYKVSQGDLLNFGEKLFPDPESVAVTERLWFTMAYSKLIDYVIDCHVIPTAITGGTLENLKVGWKTFNDISLVRTTTDYVDVDCGSVSIPEYWRNFLDFASCSCEIYLPFVGFVPIESEYWNGGTIKLVYRFNVVDGSFQAKLFSTSSKSKLTNSLIGQYGGVCCLHLPITGLQYANVITGILSAGTGVALDVQAGNYGNIPNQLSNMLSLKPDLAMSNGYSATTSFLTHRTPYLVIKRAVAQFSKKYNLENGFPLNVAKPLSSIHGFTVIDNPRLNIACNDVEYNEICNLLKTGVIF